MKFIVCRTAHANEHTQCTALRSYWRQHCYVTRHTSNTCCSDAGTPAHYPHRYITCIGTLPTPAQYHIGTLPRPAHHPHRYITHTGTLPRPEHYTHRHNTTLTHYPDRHITHTGTLPRLAHYPRWHTTHTGISLRLAHCPRWHFTYSVTLPITKLTLPVSNSPPHVRCVCAITGWHFSVFTS